MRYNDVDIFLYRSIRPYNFWLFFLVSFNLLFAALLSYKPYVIKVIVDEISTENSTSRIVFLLILYTIMVLVLDLRELLNSYTYAKVIPILKSTISLKAFEYAIGHSYKYFLDNFIGKISNVVIGNIIDNIEKIITLFIRAVVKACTTIFCIIILSKVSLIFGAISFIYSVIYINSCIKINRKLRISTSIMTKSRIKVNGIVEDIFNNILDVKLFANESFERIKFKKKLRVFFQKMKNLYTLIWRSQGFLYLSTTFFLIIFIIVLIFAKKNMLTAGDFVVISSLSFTLTESMADFSESYINFIYLKNSCYESFNEILTPYSLIDVPNAKKLFLSHEKINLKDVTFSYNSSSSSLNQKDVPIFYNLSLAIAPEAKIGIMGDSGYAKTTFVKLLTRIFDVNSGIITIDGQDISQVSQYSLRKSIGCLSQDSILFHRSFIDNISYGDISADFSRVVDAAKKARIHDFISSTSYGYNTLIGEKGSKISGGQKQRIALARIFLKNAPILIMDEPFTGLNSELKKELLEEMEEFIKHKTVIFISHEKSDLIGMDRIIKFTKKDNLSYIEVIFE